MSKARNDMIRALARTSVAAVLFLVGPAAADDTGGLARELAFPAGVGTDHDIMVETVGPTTVFKMTKPRRELSFVVEVPARVEQVWEALTTVEGIRGFYVPGGKIELWPGGSFELYYNPDGPPGERGMEGTRVLSLLPGEMLAGTGSAPPEFPTVREHKTYWVFRLHETGNGKTHVVMSMPEWPEGQEWEGAFEYLAKRNPDFTGALYKRFAEGPVDWAARGVKIATDSDEQRASKDDRRLWRVDKSLIVEAPIERIWAAFTTKEGLQKWAAPYAHVDLKVGGDYELLERPSEAVGRRGQEGTKMLAYLPPVMLSHSWLAPERYPEVREGPAWVVWRFEPQGNGFVRIRYTALGLGKGKAWENAFNELNIRMDFTMHTLRDLFSE
jgi:uncharacterized protein YndB with AHSA1/START domain